MILWYCLISQDTHTNASRAKQKSSNHNLTLQTAQHMTICHSSLKKIWKIDFVCLPRASFQGLQEFGVIATRSFCAETQACHLINHYKNGSILRLTVIITVAMQSCWKHLSRKFLADIDSISSPLSLHTLSWRMTSVMQISSLEYGPEGSSDVTNNVMEAVSCAPVLCEDAKPDAGYPLLKVKTEYLEVKDALVKQVHQSFFSPHHPYSLDDVAY